jgi:hypothetical protein
MDGKINTYINPIPQHTSALLVAKYGQKPRHGLQAADGGSVDAVLHAGDCDGGADEEAFSVREERACIERCHCVEI